MALRNKMKTSVGPPKVKSKTYLMDAPLAVGLRMARPKAASRVLKQHQQLLKGGEDK
jgi:hypothetical protein